MRAIFIAVGSELLEQDKTDTNSLYIADRLRSKGILMDMKWTVGDSRPNLTWAIKNACKRAQLVIVTGGLGPTEDDITRECAANALNRELVFREDILEDIRASFRARGIRMPDINTRQAFHLSQAEILKNSVGTAPGQFLKADSFSLLLLPGPPAEMIPMFEEVLERHIRNQSNFSIHTRKLKFAGISESETDAMISDLYSKHQNPKTTILASPGMIEVHLLGRGREKSFDEIRERTDRLADRIKEKLASFFVTDENASLEEIILRELKERGLTLGLAESCTGGGLSNRITDVPGSSEAFLGGVVAYSNHLKEHLLGVNSATLSRYGAVSSQTAREMAEGVRQRTGADIGLAITGIAGPGGGTEQKPVGLVFIHLAAENSRRKTRNVFPGDRDGVKKRSQNFALNLIREYLFEPDA